MWVTKLGTKQFPGEYPDSGGLRCRVPMEEISTLAGASRQSKMLVKQCP